MSRALTSLAGSTLWMLVALGAQAAGTGLSMIAIGHLAGRDALGIYNFAVALVLPIIMACNLGLRSQIISHYGDVPWAACRALRLLGTLAALLIIAVVTALTSPSPLATSAIIAVTGIRLCESYSDVFYGAWQTENRFRRIALSTTLRATASCITTAAALFFGANLGAALAATFAASLLVVLVYDTPRAPRHSAPFRPAEMKELLVSGLPLAASSLVNNATVSIPRLILASTSGMAILGSFSAYAYILQLLNMLIQSMGHAVGPRLARYYHAQNIAAFQQLRSSLLIAAVTLGLVSTALLACVGDTLIGLVFGPEFLIPGSFTLAFGLSAIVTFIAGISGFIITSVRAFWIQMPIQITALATCYATSHILLPGGGIAALPTVLFASSAIVALAMTIAVDLTVAKDRRHA